MVGLAPVALGLLYFFVNRTQLIVFGICVVIAVIYGVKELISGAGRVVNSTRAAPASGTLIRSGYH